MLTYTDSHLCANNKLFLAYFYSFTLTICPCYIYKLNTFHRIISYKYKANILGKKEEQFW